MSKKINYQLFRQRKNFDPTTLFKSNKSLSYKDFCSFFESRNVEPPSKEYYERVKIFCNDQEDKTTILTQLDVKAHEEAKETSEPDLVQEAKEEVLTDLEVTVEKTKSARRKRKKKANDEDSAQ
jgi:hypothetical protein